VLRGGADGHQRFAIHAEGGKARIDVFLGRRRRRADEFAACLEGGALIVAERGEASVEGFGFADGDNLRSRGSGVKIIGVSANSHGPLAGRGRFCQE